MGLRSLTRPFVRKFSDPIEAGPAAGMLVSRACGRSFKSGAYERERWESLLPLIREGDVFWDCGAHHGYVTLVAARAVGETGRVLAFEPFGRNHWFLRRHIEINGLRHAEAYKIALSNREGRARFGGGTGSGTRRLDAGREEVEVRTVDSLVERDALPAPTWLKLDVEGAEADLLEGAARALVTVQVALVATHNPEAHERSLRLLESAGFACHIPDRSRAALESSFEKFDLEPEILALREARKPSSQVLKRFLTDGVAV
jgi:FkbM family methyltransferase